MMILILIALLMSPLAALNAASPTPLAESGKALQAIVISATASAESKAIAARLSENFSRFSGHYSVCRAV